MKLDVPANVTLQVRDDGLWIVFKSSQGRTAILNFSSLANSYVGIVGVAMKEWAEDAVNNYKEEIHKDTVL